MTKVIIYTTPTCADCKMTKLYLSEKNIEFEEKNVAQDESALQEMMQKSGSMSVPVLDVDGQTLSQPSKEDIDKVLNLK